MLLFLRIIAGMAFITGGVIGVGAFEYWKVLDPGSFYLVAAAASGLCFLIGFTLCLPIQDQGFSRCFNVALTLTSLLWLSEFGFLKFKERDELNQLLQSKGRCESVVIQLFRNALDDALLEAQNSCYLRYLQDKLAAIKIPVQGEQLLTQAAYQLDREERFNETNLVRILSYYSAFEYRQHPSTAASENNALILRLQNEFSVLEGELQLLNVYRLKSFFSGEISANMEVPRAKKMVEISTLAKTMGVLLNRERAAQNAYSLIEAQKDSVGSGEIAFLQIRAQKLREGFEKVITRWNLPEALKSLAVKETYPEEYQKVLRDLAFGVP